jgi:hypothetical protein
VRPVRGVAPRRTLVHFSRDRAEAGSCPPARATHLLSTDRSVAGLLDHRNLGPASGDLNHPRRGAAANATSRRAGTTAHCTPSSRPCKPGGGPPARVTSWPAALCLEHASQQPKASTAWQRRPVRGVAPQATLSPGRRARRALHDRWLAGLLSSRGHPELLSHLWRRKLGIFPGRRSEPPAA